MVCLEQASSLVQIPSEPLPLSLPDLVCALQDCRKTRDLQHARRVHVHLCHQGLEAHASFGNHLVPLLADCGAFEDASNAFNKLVYRNEHAWTSLIQCYHDRGYPEVALSLYHKMQDDGIYPSAYTFVPLLQSCCRLTWETRGKQLHADIICTGFENDVVLGNALVDMYAKCCLFVDAHHVFDRLPHKDVYSWNILLTGYAEQGLGTEVLALYKEMLLGSLHPDTCTFVCILNACSDLRVIHAGQEIHAEIVTEGYEECTPIASKLVDLYGQCGLLEESQEVFDEVPMKDVVVWTALIAAYAEHGPAEKGLSCYQHMQLEGVNPDNVTFVCALKICDSTGDIDKGREIHAHIVKQAGSCDTILANTLVGMYARYGWFDDSRIVFKRLQDRNVVSWTALIAGYAECGLEKEALECFETMRMEGIPPNAATFTCMMQACCSKVTIKEGQMLHVEIVKQGFETDPSVCNVVLNLYINFSLLQEAQVVFDACGSHDVSSWTLLIAGYATHNLGKEVFVCLECMQMEGLSPNAALYSCCLNYCTATQSLNMGHEIHIEILKKGLEREPIIGSALMELYAKCTPLAELENLFCKLFERDVIMWNILIQAYVEHGDCKEAICCLQQMYTESVLPNTISWNVVISGFVDRGQSVKGLELYLQMLAQSLSPDGVIFVSILKACSEIATLELGKRIHSISSQAYHQSTDIELYNTLIDMYSKCGSMSLAQEVFNSKAFKNLVSWNALLAGYARHGASELVFYYFDKLTEQTARPDEITFLSVLTACSHAGLLHKGHEFLKAMTTEYGLFPTVKHYTCIIDQYSRAGLAEEVMAMAEKMPSNLDPVFWDTVFDSCKKLTNVEVEKEAFDSSVCLGENHPMAFMLLFAC